MRVKRTKFGPPVTPGTRVGAVVAVVNGQAVATIKVLGQGDVPLARSVVAVDDTQRDTLEHAAALATERLTRLLASRPGVRPAPLAIRVTV